MRYVRITLALTTMLLLVCTVAGPAGATTTRVAVSLQEPLIEVISGSEMWGNDVVTQARGFEAVYAVDFGDLGKGVVTVHANYTLKPATMTGNLWGTVVYDLGEGGFTGTFTGKWVFDENALFVGTTVARGSGDLAGWQLRTTLVEVNESLVTEEGYVFAPGS